MKAARLFVLQCFSILAIALTNVRFGLSLLGFAWTILGCSPATVHVVSADSAAFQQLLNTEMAADARRPAHLMKQYVHGDLVGKVGVLDNDKLPEAYTQNEEDAVWPANYHLGYAALRLVREFYAAAHPAQDALENGDLVEIVDKAGGNTYVLNDFDRDRQPDIADIKGRFVFEIVPPGQAQRVAGKKKVDWNLLLINQAMLGVPTFTLGTGYDGEIGVRFAEGAPPWKLSWQTIEPGVISYKWQVLSVGDATEEAYGKAWADNRWHQPTPNEMALFARALHEVVERLVQAREALGQTRADTTMPILPGKTMADYLRSVTLWNAHDEDIARLLPVMRQPPPPPPVQVRRGGRYMGQTVGDGSSGTGSAPKMHPGATTPDGLVFPPHPSAPEPYALGTPQGYTLKGRPGKMPWQFFMGYSAHIAIATHYWSFHPNGVVFRNSISVATIVDRAGGDKTLLHWSDADLRPDITHITDKRDLFVFEIKPHGDANLTKGKEKLAQYIGALNVGMVGRPKFFGPGPNYSGNIGIRFKDGEAAWNLKWDTTAPGLLQYRWRKLDVKNNEQDKATAEDYREAYENDRWRDLTTQEMEDHAEEMFTYLVESVGARELLAQFRAGTTIPIVAVGSMMEFILSANLWSALDGPSRVLPVVAKPAPGVQSRPSPSPVTKPTPAVNAQSLGSEPPATFTGSVHPTPRPAAPGKKPSGPQNVSPN